MKQQQIVQDIYREKSKEIDKEIREWYGRKIEFNKEEGKTYDGVLSRLDQQTQNTHRDMLALYNPFKARHHDRQGIREYISHTVKVAKEVATKATSSRIVEPPQNNVKLEVARFLQRVEHIMSIGIAEFMRKSSQTKNNLRNIVDTIRNILKQQEKVLKKYPLSLQDLMTIHHLMTNEAYQRQFFISETLRSVKKLAKMAYDFMSNFRDNIRSLMGNYASEFYRDVLTIHIDEMMKTELEKEEVFEERYYEGRQQTESQERQEKLKKKIEQLREKLGFQAIINRFTDALVTRSWDVMISLGDGWDKGKAILTIDGGVILLNHLSEVLAKYHMKLISQQNMGDRISRWRQRQPRKSLLRLISSSKKVESTVQFATEEQYEQFVLHCKKWHQDDR